MTKAGERLLTWYEIDRGATPREMTAIRSRLRAIEREAWNAALEAVQEQAEDGVGPITWLRDLLDSLRKETP